MRLIAIMPRTEQVGFLVDSLRNAGFDRKDGFPEVREIMEQSGARKILEG